MKIDLLSWIKALAQPEVNAEVEKLKAQADAFLISTEADIDAEAAAIVAKYPAIPLEVRPLLVADIVAFDQKQEQTIQQKIDNWHVKL